MTSKKKKNELGKEHRTIFVTKLRGQLPRRLSLNSGVNDELRDAIWSSLRNKIVNTLFIDFDDTNELNDE